jgi:XTP/dITP diphosphohydrolase
MKLVLATNNPHKVEELRAILAPLGAVELRDLSDYPEFPAAEETADSFEGNARLKAVACAGFTGHLSLADDSGLVVDALGGRPGVLSARYGPTAEARNRRVLEELVDRPPAERAARFVAVAALAWPDGRAVLRRGECHGRIADAPLGAGGFGYDPIFLLTEFGMTMAEIGEERKNRISHRARALQAILPDLRNALFGAGSGGQIN